MQKKQRKLPDGMFTKKQFLLYIASMFLYLGAIPFLVLTIITTDSIYSIIAIAYVVLCAILIIFLMGICSPLHKMEKQRNKTGDIKKYIDELENLKSDKLKEDTYNYLDILIVDSYFSYDLSKANELFVLLKKPTLKKYAIVYQLVEICYYINNGKYQEAKEKINIYSSVNPLIKKINNIGDIYCNKEFKLDNIEKSYPINTKNVYKNVNNASALLSYYQVRNDLSKAKEYATFILNQNTTMEACNSLARNILEGDVNELSR